MKGFPHLTVWAVVSALIVWAAGDSAAHSLGWDRAAIASGQWWRVASGHLCHWSGSHLLWDALMFLALGVACERSGRRRFAWTLVMTVAASHAALAIGTDYQVYRGLSGAASGAFAFLTGTLVRKGMRKRSIGRVAIGAAALLLFFGKLTWEVLAGTPLFAGNLGTSIKVAYSVHFVGLASGLAVAWAPRNLAAARSADVSKRIVDRSVEHCA